MPELGGFTDPFGTVHDPFAGLGAVGPLRMALSQPALVGEDLGASAQMQSQMPMRIKSSSTEAEYPVMRSPRSRFGELGDDYGATLVRGNHFGGDPYWGAYVPQVLESRKKKSVPGAIAAVLETLRQSGKEAGVDTAAALSVQTGVPLTEAALEVISTRKMGREELESRLANTKAAHANARKARKWNKARRLKVRMMALQSRLADLGQGKKHPVKDLPGSAGESLRIPPWVAYAGIGLGAASLIVGFIGLKGKPK